MDDVDGDRSPISCDGLRPVVTAFRRVPEATPLAGLATADLALRTAGPAPATV
jgi:hypothetical protein